MAGVSFASLVENERTAKIDINGERLAVTYSPREMTGPRLERLAQAISDAAQDGNDDKAVYVMAELFCRVVKDWNLEGPLEDADGEEVVGLGEPVPVDIECVKHIPGPMLEYVLEQLREDCRPNPQRRRA